MKTQNDKILLAHGGGGYLSSQLIDKHILPILGNDILSKLTDSAALDLDSASVCFTTDSYVIKPLFFNGGDIGKISVCGTVNDLAVAGSIPKALSLSLIIEEGLEFDILDRILASIADTAKEANVNIVTGDTKTVEAGAVDKIFINTAGIGVRIPGVNLGTENICPGDKIIINGSIGDHGMTVMAQRNDIGFKTSLKSDCAQLASLICPMLKTISGIKFMRDPTRGGLANTLNEIASAASVGIEINEKDLPIDPSVQAAADILGFDVLNIANEGKFIAAVSPQSADKALAFCRSHPLGEKASIIGTVTESDLSSVQLNTRIGGKRIIPQPHGRLLPRIC